MWWKCFVCIHGTKTVLLIKATAKQIFTPKAFMKRNELWLWRVERVKKIKKVTCYLWVELAGCMIEFHPGLKRFAVTNPDCNASADTFIYGETYAHHCLLINVPNCHFVQSTFLFLLFSLCRGSFPKIYSVCERKLIWH